MTVVMDTTLGLTNETIQYQLPWSGNRLTFLGTDRTLAIDTETPKIENEHTIPDLVIATVSSGVDHAIVMPGQLEDFLSLHWDCEFVSHNLAFDWWVLKNHLRDLGPGGLLSSWFTDMIDQGRWHDTMLLELLIELAEVGGDRGFKPKNLDELGRQWAGISVDKQDPFRLRYGEILGLGIEQVAERGFWDYAVKDAVVTHRAVGKLRQRAVELESKHTEDVGKDVAGRFGILSESIQVKAAIALADITRRGIGVDRGRLADLECGLRDQMTDAISQLRDRHPDLFDYYKEKKRAGVMKINTKTQVPRFRTKRLRELLTDIALTRGLTPPRTGKTDDIVASVEVWRHLAPDHELVQSWTQMADVSKMLQFVLGVKSAGERVHGRYRTLVTTGRTSSYTPNIQNMPRKPAFRSVFVPSVGYKLAAIDYSFIELRTLASVCLTRFGVSRLAEVIANGVDPHAFTAASVTGVPLEDFMALKASNPTEFKRHRQAAKAINFGVPGGLGAEKLTIYAKQNYDVVLDVRTAAAFRDKLINETYPEIGRYLADRSIEDMALNLGIEPSAIRAALSTRDDNDIAMMAVRKIFRGRAYKADGTAYNEWWVGRVWSGLESIIPDSFPLRDDVGRRRGSEGLERLLFDRPVSTLTGRIRANVGYTEARNTPFQGLAADGAKLTLWELMREGFRVVAFVHDEVVIEVVDDADVTRAVEIMNEGMNQVLHPLVPSACEASVGMCWSKS